MNRGIQLIQRNAVNISKIFTMKPQPLQCMSTKSYPNQEVPVHGHAKPKHENDQNTNQTAFVDMKPSPEHFSLDPKYPEPRMVKVATR